MANYNHHHHHAVLLLVFLFLISSSSSYARLLNIALPREGVVLKEKEEQAGHVLPCEHMVVDVARKRLSGGKYGRLILNMLPKGTVPPSGPSKGINNINN
ncbi:hypothetical protein RIF29_11186 [Crotalaria pallida]|uniref:Uncharacterized protein n=1 Tax=Crotalaria pallida TaxID=3830 RepID=A0AAN9ILW4_CROPI